MSDKNNLNESFLEEIEQYLLNAMSDEDRALFEAKIAATPELYKEVEIHKDLLKSVQVGAMKSELETMHTEIFPEEQDSKKTSPIWKWSIAAGVAALLGLSLFVGLGKSQSDQLFTEHMTTDPGLPVLMSAYDSYEFYSAMVHYKQGDYERALSEWQRLRKFAPPSDTLNYYIGSAFFNVGDFENAVNEFRPLSLDGQGEIEAKSMWYLALSYLKTGQTDELLSLKPIPGSLYEAKIIEIQTQLNK
jgi:tetratricopeptide (TPR) repeat protein